MLLRRALIIGGTQFIGPAISRSLLEGGWQVTCFHRGKTASPLAETTEIFGDRSDSEALRRALSNGFDAVVDTCAYGPADMDALIPLLKAEQSRYLLVSTVSVYAEMVRFPVDEDQPYFEGDPSKNSASAYASGKVQCEKRVIASGIPFTILRPAFIYGPWNTLYREAYYFDLIEQGRNIFAGGTGAYLTQLLHVHDLAAGVAACLDSEGTLRKAYNITDQAITQRKALEILTDSVNPGRCVEDGPADYAPWGIRRHLCVCTSAIRRDTGWRPSVSLSDGMAETHGWYLAHAEARRSFWESHAFKVAGGR